MIERAARACLVCLLTAACQGRRPAPEPVPPRTEASAAEVVANDEATSDDHARLDGNATEPNAAYWREVEAKADARDGRLTPPSESQLAWDREHLEELLAFFRDVQCRRVALAAKGEAFIAAPASEDEWIAHEDAAYEASVAWTNDLFRRLPRSVESSRALGTLLEGNEVVTHTLCNAYGERDPEAVAEAAMAFDVIETQMRRYVAMLGGQLPTVDAAACS